MLGERLDEIIQTGHSRVPVHVAGSRDALVRDLHSGRRGEGGRGRGTGERGCRCTWPAPATRWCEMDALAEEEEGVGEREEGCRCTWPALSIAALACAMVY